MDTHVHVDAPKIPGTKYPVQRAVAYQDDYQQLFYEDPKFLEFYTNQANVATWKQPDDAEAKSKVQSTLLLANNRMIGSTLRNVRNLAGATGSAELRNSLTFDLN